MALFKEEEAVGKDHSTIPGTPKPAELNKKILIIDADTIVYSVASVYEFPEEILPGWHYAPGEHDKLTGHDNYDAETNSIWRIELDKAFEAVKGKVANLVYLTGCASVELHFTSGKNFRYDVDPGYKSNRKSTRYPVGLRDLKKMAVDEYDVAMIHSEIEADDYVVWRKKQLGTEAVLCAVDKDVLRGCAGLHLNYYESSKYNIPMKWVSFTDADAFKFPFQQCLEGDTADGIEGVKGIGPKKAIKLLDGLTTKDALWEVVVGEFSRTGKSRAEAVVTMQLVNMNQLNDMGELTLWQPPEEDVLIDGPGVMETYPEGDPRIPNEN